MYMNPFAAAAANTLARAAVGAFCLLLAGTAAADKPRFNDTLQFSLGGMQNNADIKFSDTLEGFPPFELNLQELGMDDKSDTLWVGINWQFVDSWGMNFSYSSFKTDGLATATEGGNFGDIEWSADATLASDFDLELYIVDLHWDFVNTGRSHFGVGLGLHIADLSAGIDFTLVGDVNGQPVVIDSGRGTASVTAPLPNVSLRGGHRFGENWYLGATAGYFTLKVDDIDGELVTFRANLEWRPVRHFGLGLGYQYVSLDVTSDDGFEREKFDADFYGPILFVTAAL